MRAPRWVRRRRTPPVPFTVHLDRPAADAPPQLLRALGNLARAAAETIEPQPPVPDYGPQVPPRPAAPAVTDAPPNRYL